MRSHLRTTSCRTQRNADEGARRRTYQRPLMDARPRVSGASEPIGTSDYADATRTHLAMRVRVRARCAPAHEAMKKFSRGSGGGGAAGGG